MNGFPTDGCNFIENRTFDEIEVGDHASLVRTLSQRDIELFAAMSGDVNPAHMDPAYASTDMFHRVIAHGMWGGALVSTVLGTELPGPGTIYLSQDLHFHAPIGWATPSLSRSRPGRRSPTGSASSSTAVQQPEGREGDPGHRRGAWRRSEKIRRPRIDLPEVRLATHDRFQRS